MNAVVVKLENFEQTDTQNVSCLYPSGKCETGNQIFDGNESTIEDVMQCTSAINSCSTLNYSKLASSALHIHHIKEYNCSAFSHSNTQSPSNQLETHKQANINVKDFRCSVCDKVFSARSNMKSHEKSHNGAKRYY